jgi:ATP-dependent DNA helicase DinG
MHDIFGSAGPLAQRVPHYAPRIQQQEMAQAVADALADEDVLIAEAGTGTGKTFAYLVPALLSGLRVIVSTGTRNLQDQIFHRDLPAVRAALRIPARVALLKGRANYLCLHRLDRAAEQARFRAAQQAHEYQRVVAWARQTRAGDVAELADVPEDAAVWPWVTSTADNCLGQNCPQFSDCFLTKARREAQQADLVVVNHHLFCADLALRDEGYGELLPGAHAWIIDEAHQLPQVATNFFGQSLSSRQLLELTSDCVIEHKKEALDAVAIESAADRLRTAVLDLRLALGADARRAVWNDVRDQRGVHGALARVREDLYALHATLEPHAPRGSGLDHCWRRSATLSERLDRFDGAAPDDQVQWMETYARSFTFNLTPLDVGPALGASLRQRRGAWIFTSATLAVGDDFSHFARRVGVEDARSRRWDSPFDFARQAVLYLPPHMPEPNAPGYNAAVVAATLPALRASGGRAFLLFTSHRALREAHALLRDEIDYPLLVQGTLPRPRLLDEFRAAGNAVLLGTSSFWEGVDVRGEALSLVVIDKLPFAAPDDPLVRARAEAMRARGENPFLDDQLPQAVITLKQGVGRLIRDVTDRGVMVLCDPRLLNKSYGRRFLDSLPPMHRTRALDDVVRFFAADAVAEAAG